MGTRYPENSTNVRNLLPRRIFSGLRERFSGCCRCKQKLNAANKTRMKGSPTIENLACLTRTLSPRSYSPQHSLIYFPVRTFSEDFTTMRSFAILVTTFPAIFGNSAGKKGKREEHMRIECQAMRDSEQGLSR